MGINIEWDGVYVKDILELQARIKSEKYPTYRLVFNFIRLWGNPMRDC
jgi:hypothetical protein